MASLLNAMLAALVAAALWTLLGYALGRRLLPRALASGAAPVLGWAVHSAITLPLFTLIGFTPSAVIVVAVLCVIAAVLSFRFTASGDAETAAMIPPRGFAAAALFALAPSIAIVPKFSGDAVYLANPIFDHSKIAIIDAMTRQGLPPVDPVYGAAAGHGQFFYYYLWHYSAAELAQALRVTGWEADIALTWFTAFASLCLLMGIAVWLGKKPGAAIWVVLLAAATSLRVALSWVFGSWTLVPFLDDPSGFAGWLFQAAWAPQHVMSATCVVLAMLLIARYALQQRIALLLMLALVVVAGFESSTYVGGITFTIAALIAAPLLIAAMERASRLRFAVGMAVAATIAIVLALPFLNNQLYAVAARSHGGPIAFHHFAVLGSMFPEGVRRALDWPAYWLILLPIEFPGTYLAGAIAIAVMLRSGVARPEKLVIVALACLVGAGLLVPWLLVSTIGDNNDLGLRAVLPAASILIATAAAGLVLLPRRAVIGAVAIAGLVLSLPDTVRMLRSNIEGQPVADGVVFAQTPELWAAVRQFASPSARVANNPLFLEDVTSWPANISWALLANRSSCFAGRELALALAPLPDQLRESINAQFIRVFAGEGTPQDTADIARKYGCDIVVIVPQDKAWANDPFAANPDYRLVDSRDGKWRIYTVVKTEQTIR
jgi:hypothetical protein